MNPPPDIVTGRIFIRGVNWLGDAVMTTPALMRLRQAYPAAQITLLTAEKLAEAVDLLLRDEATRKARRKRLREKKQKRLAESAKSAGGAGI